MTGFRKTVKGLDFQFELMQADEMYYYLVEIENHSFELRIDDNGVWKIKGQVPIWLQELEESLGEAIEEATI